MNQKQRNDDKFLKRLKVALDWYVLSSIPGLRTVFNRPVTVEISWMLKAIRTVQKP